ncbi:MAG: hypothetical protein RIR18_2052 [Pseudomonadota bacterium]|jgi:hypothetical protein
MARKKSKRVVRSVSYLLPPNQHTDLMVQPRMHWTLILSGNFETEYLLSLIGLFNIAGAIAFIKKSQDLVKRYSEAQTTLLSALKSKSLSEDEISLIGSSLNHVDRYLGVQTKQTIRAAVEYVQSAVDGKLACPLPNEA